jgi:hypothetical protein
LQWVLFPAPRCFQADLVRLASELEVFDDTPRPAGMARPPGASAKSLPAEVPSVAATHA